MKKKIGKRLIQFIPVFLGITFLSFVLMAIAPGDAAAARLSAGGTTPSPEAVEAMRVRMGLDKPMIVQYLTWLLSLIKGDMGISFANDLPVASRMMTALPYTLKMAGSSMILTLIISIPLGIYTALKKDKAPDYIIRFFTFIGNSLPNFIIAIILLYIFSVKLQLIPILATKTIKGMILPASTLALVMSSRYIRQVRAAVLDELNKDYVVGARARGISERNILYRNVLKNVMITVVTLTGISIGSLLGGTVVVETIFNWPGLGEMVMKAISARDYPVIQGFVVWMAIIYTLVNIVTDYSYTVFNPKIKEV